MKGSGCGVMGSYNHLLLRTPHPSLAAGLPCMALLLTQISLECHPLESFGDIHHASIQLKSLRKFYRKILLLSMFSRSVTSNSFATPWTVACQAPLSMELSKQEYWSGLPFPSPEDLPDPGIKPSSHAVHCITGGFFTADPLLLLRVFYWEKLRRKILGWHKTFIQVFL